MAKDNSQVAFTVTPRQKRAIRRAAAEQDVTMAEIARNATLETIAGRHFRAPDSADVDGFEPVSPLEDFIESCLTVDPDAAPLAKKQVYECYRQFCAERHPGHDVESQHKVSRELAQLDGVKTGRRYLQETPTNNSVRTRCYLNIKITR